LALPLPLAPIPLLLLILLALLLLLLLLLLCTATSAVLRSVSAATVCAALTVDCPFTAPAAVGVPAAVVAVVLRALCALVVSQCVCASSAIACSLAAQASSLELLPLLLPACSEADQHVTITLIVRVGRQTVVAIPKHLLSTGALLRTCDAYQTKKYSINAADVLT
jgi:hypothetical protein